MLCAILHLLFLSTYGIIKQDKTATERRRMHMGIYLNPGNDLFAEAANSEIYVDKTMLIGFTNQMIGTSQKHIGDPVQR